MAANISWYGKSGTVKENKRKKIVCVLLSAVGECHIDQSHKTKIFGAINFRLLGLDLIFVHHCAWFPSNCFNRRAILK